MHEDSVDLPTIAAHYQALEREAIETLRHDGIDESRIRVVREADMRYAGQSMEVRIVAPGGAIDATFLAALIEAFHAAHLRTFGYNYASQQKVEFVNFCVSGFGMIERPSMPKLASGMAKPTAKATRPVYFGREYQDTPIYDRANLTPGFTLAGPAVIEEFGSTTVLFPGHKLEVDPHGILVVRPAPTATETAR
jgi:N-methylhydantoinase A